MHHSIHLDTHRYDKVCSGEKTIELRLYDKKRREISVSDTIQFCDRDSARIYIARISELPVYPTFYDLLRQHAWNDM
jgi:ASC-1-like (ASCH) protein